jgi:hypothetical protein
MAYGQKLSQLQVSSVVGLGVGLALSFSASVTSDPDSNAARFSIIPGRVLSLSCSPGELLLVLAGWINKHEQNAIEYLLTENRIL